ncbi:MAG: hypothetical protein HYY44_03070 [Deltaproteobacteria bacterium]|nr:hypothetical protein [Deltaproteobacteria bacterium]
MHRTLIQLDEDLYQIVKTRAFEAGVSLSAFVRKVLDKAVRGKKKKTLKIDAFKFIGMGCSDKGKNVSEEHDKYLFEDD